MTILKYDPFSANNNAIKQISGAGQGAGGPNAYSDRAFLVSLINDLVDQINNGSGGNSGLTLLSSGSMAGQFVDILLTGSYVAYSIGLYGLATSIDGDELAFVLSSDGGATWLYSAITAYYSDKIGTLAQAAQLFNLPTVSNLSIFMSPGDTSGLPLLVSEWGAFPASGPRRNLDSDGIDQNASPPIVRYNAIRLMPFGNGDNPPTSGYTFTHGVYRLWGIT